MKCNNGCSERYVVKNGFRQLLDGTLNQRYYCKQCKQKFSEHNYQYKYDDLDMDEIQKEYDKHKGKRGRVVIYNTLKSKGKNISQAFVARTVSILRQIDKEDNKILGGKR